jgi:hypothetical protein
MLEQKHFKSAQCFNRFSMMHPKLQEIAIDAVDYALKIGVTHSVITETVTTEAEDKALNRVSDTHRTCRAFDFRVIDWNGEQIDAMLEYLQKYKDIGAETENGRVIALYHDNGHGLHFHVQIDRSFSLPNNLS